MYPAGEPGISVRYTALPNGVRIRIIESGPANGRAVMLMHGWGASVYSFAEVVPALASAGFRTIAFDLPGHGLSERPDDESMYATEALADLVLTVADASDVRQFDFVGHSMGGALGLELATRPEPRLERLVLINAVGMGTVPLIPPVRLLSPPILNRISPLLLRRRTVAWILRVAFGSANRPTERDVDEYWAPTQFDNPMIACRACVHRVTWRRRSAAELRSLGRPVLVIAGGRDPLVRGVAKRAVLIPKSRLVLIPEGGHLVQQECAPSCNIELLTFLRR